MVRAEVEIGVILTLRESQHESTALELIGMQPALIEDQDKVTLRVSPDAAPRELPVECESLKSSFYLNCTAWLNQIVGAILFIPMSVPMLLVAILTKISSPGPVIYTQTRVGRRGKVFVLYKIRSMRQDAETATGPVWTATNDTRITKVGWFLRKSHLDELPQLFNVIKGDMVLIGPRPERPEFTHYLGQAVPGYINRLAAKPGITGVAQILLPPDSDLEGVRLKLAADLKYIRSAGVWMDVRIMTCTFLRMFGISGEKVARFFGFTKAWIEEPLSEIREMGKNAPHYSTIDSSSVPATFAAAIAGKDATESERTPEEADSGTTTGATTEPVSSANPGLPR